MKRHARHAFVAAGPAAPAPASPPSVTAAMSCATPKNTKSASVDATAAAGDANFTDEPITYTKGVAETTNRARATTSARNREEWSSFSFCSSAPAIPPAVNSNNVAASVGVCKHTSHANVPHQYASRLMPETICKCLAPVLISRAGNGAAADAESALNDTTTHSDTNNRESSAFSCFSV